jgi:signal transduction histidine kinase/DNA-binding response OmpR family regulator/ligand-binding sensor domain-containing protein
MTLSGILIIMHFQLMPGQKILIPEPNSFQGKFLHYPIKEPGADISTTRLFLDSKGFLWSGTFNGLYRFDGNRNKTYGFKNSSGTSLAGHLVSSIFEDSAGIMWIGTFGALNKLDQKTGKIDQFVPDSGNFMSDDNRIRFISEDRSGLLWIITAGDVFTFNKNTFRFKRYQYDEPVLSLTNKSGQFLEDSKGRIWIVSSNGLYKYSRKEDQFKVFRHNPDNLSDISSNRVSSIVEDASGVLWCSTTDGGLNRISDPDYGIFERIKFNSPADQEKNFHNISTLIPGRDGLLWIFGDGIFASYSTQTGEMKSYLVRPVNEMFNNSRGDGMLFDDAFQDDNGAVWFLQREGIVFRFDPESEKLRLFAIPNWIVFDWIRDHCGSHWFGCANGNTWRLMINLLHYQSVRVNNMFNVAIYNNPRLAFDNNSKIWLALSTGIYVSDFNEDLNFKAGKMRLHIGDTVANCILKDHSGNLWVSISRNRIVRINSTDNSYKTLYLPENIEGIIYNIMEDSHGNLWFLSYNKIFVLHEGSEKIETLNNEKEDLKKVMNEGVYDICIDKNDGIWFASFSDGVYKYDQEKKNVIKYLPDPETDLMTGDYCIRIKEDSRGRIWLLYALNGLYLFNQVTERLNPVSLMDNIPSGIAFSDLFIKSDNTLMVNHNYGITLYNPDKKALRQIPFIQQPGSYCSIQLSTGHVLNLSGSELKLFHDTIPLNTVIPQVYLTGLTINENEVNTQLPDAGSSESINEIKLRHNQNNIKIDFASMNLLYPENNRFRYFMSDVDEDTVQLNNYHTVEYNNLNPGRYKFWFTGSNNDGIWNTDGKTLDIHIKPPLIRSVYAFILYGFLFLVLLADFMRRHFHRLNAEKKRLEDEVHARTLELEKKNQQIEQLDRMKTRFFTEISHELRTPLSLIMGPIDNLITENGKIDDVKRTGLMEMIRRNSIRLLNLVNQLLDISRIDAGKMRITLAESDLLKSLRILVYEYLSTAENRKIKFIIDISDESYIALFDKDKIEKIVSNLLSNAFKFTPAHGTVLCTIKIKKPDNNGSPPLLEIMVQDTGVGISKENLDKIFDRFYRVEGQWEKDGRGTGIGLSLTSEFVTLLHGYIEVTSEKDVGSAFTVRIPVGKDHLSPDEYVVVETHPYSTGVQEIEFDQHSILKEAETAGKKSQLLIIEDNRDLRDFIKDNLLKDYHVYEAGNGKAGIDIAFAKIPDLVLTDIIMPDLDGMEVCRRLKNDERTSHIPVIILSAKTTQENRIEGFASGADDYLSKPFDMNELRIRISNLLVQRAKLRHKYGLIAESGDYGGSSATVDDLFMRKINSIINENIKNFDFDVGVLQEKLGMSRIHLYRKLKALTGLSPSSIIHYHRMKLAAKMIRDKKSNLTEIALSIGISNPSYFSRCFREFYGVSPKDFVNQPENVTKVKG